MKDLKLAESEYRFMKIVWENQPLASAGLVKLCAEKMGWKKSTTYTVLKRLGEKGIVKNDNSKIIPLVTEKDVQLFESNSVVLLPLPLWTVAKNTKTNLSFPYSFLKGLFFKIFNHLSDSVRILF